MIGSALSVRFQDLKWPPTPSDDAFAMTAFVDTENAQGHATIRRLIGQEAETWLSVHPGRFVLFVLWRDNTAWIRICPTEDFVVSEAMKVLREANQATPPMVEMVLLLEPELRQRVTLAVLSQYSTPSARA